MNGPQIIVVAVPSRPSRSAAISAMVRECGERHGLSPDELLAILYDCVRVVVECAAIAPAVEHRIDVTTLSDAIRHELIVSGGPAAPRAPRAPRLTDWAAGPPPCVGWWIASVCRNADVRRYWNGTHWSQLVRIGESDREAERRKLSLRSARALGRIEWRGLAEEPTS